MNQLAKHFFGITLLILTCLGNAMGIEIYRRHIVVLGFIVMVWLAISPVNAQAYVLQQTFNDPTPTFNDNFGNSVAIDGDKVLIGAFGNGPTNVGQAHLFSATSIGPVPEPSTYAMAGIGLLGLGFYGWRRRGPTN